MLLPRLVAQWCFEDRRTDAPLLLTGDLQDEDVVDVVVVGEALILRRRDIGIDLDRVAEVVSEVRGEGLDR